jgi:hypothetical protein
MERWISQDIGTEMWNNVQDVSVTCPQQAGVGVRNDGSEEAVHGSETGKFESPSDQSHVPKQA